MAKAPSVEWTHEHRLMALCLYRLSDFGRLHSKNPQIQQVADKMGRSAGSLALKLVNFAALDPFRPQKGMVNASEADRILWGEYATKAEDMHAAGMDLLHELFGLRDDQELDFMDRGEIRVIAHGRDTDDDGDKTRADKDIRKLRRGYAFFRQAVLNIYDVQCCITGIAVPRLLVANHIRPPRDFPHERFNLNNGLCLSGLHSPAFIGGLIALDEERRLVLGRSLKKEFSKEVLKANFEPYEGRPIRPPNILAEPSAEGLAYHYKHVFKG